jgi:hypothetical protein
MFGVRLWSGTEALAKTLGVIGCGRIGRQVAHYAQGFGMNVIAFDDPVPEADLKAVGIEKVCTQGPPVPHCGRGSLGSCLGSRRASVCLLYAPTQLATLHPK